MEIAVQNNRTKIYLFESAMMHGNSSVFYRDTQLSHFERNGNEIFFSSFVCFLSSRVLPAEPERSVRLRDVVALREHTETQMINVHEAIRPMVPTVERRLCLSRNSR